MIVRLALIYWCAIFALGFALGVVRRLVLAPLVGELAAVLIELPIMLSASWLLARRLVLGNRLAANRALAVGVLAFAVLMASEAALAMLVPGADIGSWIAGMGQRPGAIGLAGQVAFGLLPWWVARTSR